MLYTISRRVVAAHEPLADLHPAHRDRPHVAVDRAGLDAGHPTADATEVAGNLPHVVRAARDVDLVMPLATDLPFSMSTRSACHVGTDTRPGR